MLRPAAAPPKPSPPLFLAPPKARQWGTLSRNVTHPTGGQLLLRLLDLLRVVKLIKKLPGRFRARHLVPQHLSQTRIFPQLLEILQTIPAHPAHQQETLDVVGFFKSPLPLC